MPLKVLIVMPALQATWVRDMELLFPPFPGLGIRVDVYDVLNIDSVVVGDHGYDVTCIVHLEGNAEHYTEKKFRSLGFEIGVYP
ncbi:MAG TPA: hypothetical protein VHL11_20760 [Phototrophicaceae bacterium]|jgi:hypothetical protein|nr:hypothetical protein [Phototrophicaceae bacterium]